MKKICGPPGMMPVSSADTILMKKLDLAAKSGGLVDNTDLGAAANTI